LPNSLTPNQLKTLARYGAQVRLAEIRTEIAAMEALLAEVPSEGAAGREQAPKAARRRRRRGKLSPEGRANIIAAQKARWAKLKSQRSATSADPNTAAPAAKTTRNAKRQAAKK